jgi:MFS family permease
MMRHLFQSLRQAPRDLNVMALAQFTWGMGEGLFLIFQSITLEKWGANPVEIGSIFGAMGIVIALAQAPAGWLGDRVGSRPVMWSAWILGTLAAVIMALANSLAGFVAGMLIYGLTSFVTAPMNSYITGVRGKFTVERVLTISMALYFLGSVAGSLIGGMIAEGYGLPAIYRLSAAVFALSTLIVFQARREPQHEPGEAHAGQPNLARNPRFLGLLGLIFVTMFALSLAQPLTPNYLQNVKGFSLQTIGQLGAVGSLGNALLALGLGHLSAPVGFLIGQGLVGLFVLLMWRGEAPALFFLGYFLLGGYRLARSMVMAYSRAFVRAGEVGFAYGLVETGNATSAILAPLAAGLLYSKSPQAMYIASLVAIGAVLLVNSNLLPKLHKAAHPAVQPGAVGENDAT